jgi:hypothetical protein
LVFKLQHLRKQPISAAIPKIHRDWVKNKKLGAKINSPALKVTSPLTQNSAIYICFIKYFSVPIFSLVPA